MISSSLTGFNEFPFEPASSISRLLFSFQRANYRIPPEFASRRYSPILSFQLMRP
jgi:hypothetical protein